MKLSIVTINFGTTLPLKATIASVNQQCQKAHEHIILASGIAAGEAEELQSRWGSENRRFIFNKDKSLYNAMNIGLETSTGNCILFLNGGDSFYDKNCIKSIAEIWEPNVCLIFRTAQQWKDAVYIRPSARQLSDLLVMPGHQGFIAPISVKKLFYDEDRLVNADSIWMQQYLLCHEARLSEAILAKFSLGGISNFPSFRSVMLRYRSSGSRRALQEGVKLALRVSLGAALYYRLLAKLKSYERTTA